MARINGNNSELTQKINGQPPQEKKPEGPGTTIASYFKSIEPTLAQVLPKHLNIERLTRLALTIIRTNPKLMACDMKSLAGAVMQSAQLGLEPGLLGHCYIIPYGREATFIIGYRGMIDLARRSGDIQSISAHEVYENDFLELEYGLNENLRHIPWHLRKDEDFDRPGNLRGFYMVAKFKDGGYYVHYMSKHEIEEHRERSKSKNNGPWVTDYVEMGKKTVVRAGWKWLPISVEVMRQAESSDESSKDILSVVNDGPDVTEYTEMSFTDERTEDEESPEPQKTPEETFPNPDPPDQSLFNR